MDIYRIKDLGFKLQEGAGLIKAQDVADLSTANDIVSSSEQRAAQIVEEAETHFQNERERGFREGQIAAQEQALERLLDEHTALLAHLNTIEGSLVKLITASVRQVVSAASDPDLAEALVQSALGKVRRENRVQIRLPETLMDDFKTRINGLISMFPQIEFIELIEDSRLIAPNIIVETAVGRIDCDLGAKLDNLEMVIKQAVQGRTGPQAEPGHA